MSVFTVLAGLALVVCRAAESRAQPADENLPTRFTRAVDVEPHLPQSTVYQILEDQRGFLWFATREGLGRLDGYTMRTWRVDPFDEASLPGNVVRQLVEDGDGNLWLRTETTDRNPAGIARLAAPAHDSVERYDHLDAHVFMGPDAIAWLADSDSRDEATMKYVGRA